MANREELGIIRRARAGAADAQLQLGKLYLFGSAGLPRSLPTALHWFERAALQDCAEAWELIGTHIPLEVARQSARPVLHWYQRAHASGVREAGLVLAQLVLETAPGAGQDPAERARALHTLASAAEAGVGEAQWLLSQHQGHQAANCVVQDTAPAWPPRPHALAPAQQEQLDSAWEQQAWDLFLQQALPLARALVRAADALGKAPPRLAPDQVRLLSRCARALGEGAPEERRRFWELAAAEHDRHAQLAVGLWHARMRVDGKRIAVGAGSANFKKAIRWLTLAGEQGLAEAWYALSRIYIKPEFSQRDVADAQKYLERAAEMGYRDAQLELGNSAWRARRENENNDVRALFWLQKAASQGCEQAKAALRKIAPRPLEPAEGGALAAGRALAATHPLLAARLELAALFGLNRAEALLLDIKSADRGHCLVVDIRSSYGRGKRRLVLIDSAQERHALDRIAGLFEHIDSGPGGPEGNYRQRLYRLKTLVPGALGANDPQGGDIHLAA